MTSMQRGYTKLFNTIITSSIWQEDDHTRIVWITLLALADRYGVVAASLPGLANVANLSLEATSKAIKILESKDEHSRNRANEGRRIQPIEDAGGWHILNYVQYRDMLTSEERKEYKAKWEKQKRARVREGTGVYR